MSSLTIGFVGMTHLGLNSAVAGAELGFNMICFDTDKELVTRLKMSETPVLEPDLDKLITANCERLTFTSDAGALQDCDVIYVAADIATDDQGKSDLSTINIFLALAFDHAKKDAAIIVLSQVPPGYTRAHQRKGQTLIYQVETLIFGQAIERALRPERFIIGVSDPKQPLPAAYVTYLEGHGNPPLLPMRYESAELAKISINCCLVASISVANTLAEICEKIGADWSEIVPALKLDRRIGPYSYLAPGLGISGGNLERDLATVLQFSRANNTDSGVVKAWLHNSKYRKGWSYNILKIEVLDKNPTAQIAVLGLAYKENTHSIKNSPSLACLSHLEGKNISVFDPVVKGSIVPFAKDAFSIEDCISGADVLMILTPWAEFRGLDAHEIAQSMRGKTVIDPYLCLSKDDIVSAGLDYITLGAPAMRARRGPVAYSS